LGFILSLQIMTEFAKIARRAEEGEEEEKKGRAAEHPTRDEPTTEELDLPYDTWQREVMVAVARVTGDDGGDHPDAEAGPIAFYGACAKLVDRMEALGLVECAPELQAAIEEAYSKDVAMSREMKENGGEGLRVITTVSEEALSDLLEIKEELRSDLTQTPYPGAVVGADEITAILEDALALSERALAGFAKVAREPDEEKQQPTRTARGLVARASEAFWGFVTRRAAAPERSL
jgi:hypothetical protein